ncbi:fibrinogen-like protein 1 [Drosophila willistoni]|uniref:fibrinogen-like protein 1 n=1 Tax=Drosophila willistoni TaxID=7260 RepID=UPI001F073F62|nr:fibrinogen-like protein 1 [Drosophila willistoni]
MNLQRLILLSGLFLFLGFVDVISKTFANEDDFWNCGIASAQGDICGSCCYKSVKVLLAYATELKEQVKSNDSKNAERDEEIAKLRKKLLEIDYYRGQNTEIDELQKANEMLRKTNDDLLKLLSQSIQHQNNVAKNEELKAEIAEVKLRTKYQSIECIARQDNLKQEIELLRKKSKDSEETYKIVLESSKSDLANLRLSFEKELKSKEKLANEINELKSQLASYQKNLEDAQNQIVAKNSLIDSHSLKLNQTEISLSDCKRNLPKTGCKGLPSGIHLIEIPGLDPFRSLCKGETDGNGWIVVHRRLDDRENFKRNWIDFRSGFGDLNGNFFIGLEKLHRITQTDIYELSIEIGFHNDTFANVRYTHFKIGDETKQYELESLGEFRGMIDNRMALGIGQKFTTYDRDNDLDRGWNCATVFYGAWWYDECGSPNLNGRYYTSATNSRDSMSWNGWNSLKSVQMLIRPKNSSNQ